MQVRIKGVARWESSIIKLLGLIEMILAIALIFPAVVAIYYGENSLVFLYPVPFLLILGAFQYIFFKSGESLKPASGMLMMFIAWWIAFLVSALPYYLYGFSFIDSLFESVSGFTATGATIFSNATTPQSLLFWMAFTQWAGGIAIIVIFLFLMPMMGIGGRTILNNELAGSEMGNFSMRIKNAVWNFVIIYVVLTLVGAMLLIGYGESIYSSLTLMFSTISTGGFLANADSMADFPFFVQLVVVVFMFLGSTNFYLHYRALKRRNFSVYKNNQEFIWTIIWFLFVTVVLIAILVSINGYVNISDFGNTVWDSFFTVVSMGTSTGFTIMGQSYWPIAAYVILWVVMSFGSGAGSTSAGIKIYRIMILKSYISNGIYKSFHPRAVRDVKIDGHPLSGYAVTSAIVLISLFFFTIIVSTIFILISEPGMDITNSLGLSVAALGNSGANMGTAAWQGLNSISMIFMMFVMWAGRLEMLSLMMFTGTFWSDLVKDLKGNRSAAKSRNAKNRKI